MTSHPGNSPNGERLHVPSNLSNSIRTDAVADRLEELLEQMCIAELSQDEWDELATALTDNRLAIRRYVESIHLREFLRDCTGMHSSASPALLEAPSDSIESPQQFLKSVKRSSGGLDQQVSWTPLVLAMSLALVIGVVGGMLLNRDAARPSFVNLESAETTSSLSNGLTPWDGKIAQRDRMGRITGLSPDASADGLLRSYQVREPLRRGEVLQLTRGVMRIQLSSGPEALINGPAEFSIVGEREIFVRHGRIHASGEGAFRVQSTLVTAECRDAELALVADRDRSAILHAYKGQAKVQTNPPRNVRRELVRQLETNKSVEITAEPGTSRLSFADVAVPPRVVRSWEEVTNRLHGYEQLVLSDRPLAYWPLYRVRRNRRVLDLTQNGFDGQAIGNWPAELSDASSSQVRGAYFDGESYIEPDRKPPVDLTTGFTIESWAKVLGGPEFQSVFTSRWVFGSCTPNEQCFGFTLYVGDDDHWQLWSGTGEYGVNWRKVVAPVKVDRTRWTHVAASFEPQSIAEGQWVDGIVRMYVDGEQVAEETRRMSLVDFEWPARIGAAEFVPRALTSWLFQGELRDVALYDHVLSPEHVIRHAESGEAAI